MRINHELRRGVICEKCLCETRKEHQYKRINVLMPLVEDSTGRCNTILKLNLCSECYEEYKNNLTKWLND